MLSDHLQNGIETAKLVWSRLPTAEDDAGPAAAEEEEDVFARRSNGGSGMESLDYEIIENYAYREHQVRVSRVSTRTSGVLFCLFCFFVFILLASDLLCTISDLAGAERKAVGFVLCGSQVAARLVDWYW